MGEKACSECYWISKTTYHYNSASSNGTLVSGTTYTSFSRGLAVANIVYGAKDNFYKE